jgi:hypothetical protein
MKDPSLRGIPEGISGFVRLVSVGDHKRTTISRLMDVACVLPCRERQEPVRAADSLPKERFAMATRIDNEIRELSPEEWAQRVDENARKYLGMTGEEFERRLKAGEIDIDDSPAVTRVAMMLPLHAAPK